MMLLMLALFLRACINNSSRILVGRRTETWRVIRALENSLKSNCSIAWRTTLLALRNPCTSRQETMTRQAASDNEMVQGMSWSFKR